jgi:hypothetical protein
MNIVSSIFLICVVIILFYVGLKVWKINRWLFVMHWSFAILIIIIVINGYILRLPNPFDLRKAVITEQQEQSPRDIGPITTPPTNADPESAAKRQFELLDQAKERQTR